MNYRIRYTGCDESSSLEHWKYTRKEKVNGKWRYYYDNDKLGIKNFIDTKITGEAYKQHEREVVKRRTAVGNESFSTTQDRAHAEQTSVGYSQDDPKVKALKAKEADLKKQYESLSRESTNVSREYYTASLKGISESTIRRGKKAIANMLRRLADKID